MFFFSLSFVSCFFPLLSTNNAHMELALRFVVFISSFFACLAHIVSYTRQQHTQQKRKKKKMKTHFNGTSHSVRISFTLTQSHHPVNESKSKYTASDNNEKHWYWEQKRCGEPFFVVVVVACCARWTRACDTQTQNEKLDASFLHLTETLCFATRSFSPITLYQFVTVWSVLCILLFFNIFFFFLLAFVYLFASNPWSIQIFLSVSFGVSQRAHRSTNIKPRAKLNKVFVCFVLFFFLFFNFPFFEEGSVLSTKYSVCKYRSVWHWNSFMNLKLKREEKLKITCKIRLLFWLYSKANVLCVIKNGIFHSVWIKSETEILDEITIEIREEKKTHLNI